MHFGTLDKFSRACGECCDKTVGVFNRTARIHHDVAIVPSNQENIVRGDIQHKSGWVYGTLCREAIASGGLLRFA